MSGEMCEPSKRLIRAARQSRLRQVRASIRYKSGYQVPRNYEKTVKLHNENGNSKWQDAIDLELQQIHEYQGFRNLGKATYEKGKVTNLPTGYTRKSEFTFFDVKHDGRHKARLVADGHLTRKPVETFYTGVVSLRDLRLTIFLTELNNLEVWGADIGNA